MRSSRASRAARRARWATPLAIAVVLLGALTPASAFASTVLLTDQASCTALGGSWSVDTCTVTSLQIDPDGALQVGFGTRLVVNGRVLNNGTIANLGSFIENNAGASIDNRGTISNDGTINNAGTVNNSGIVNNNATGTINNNQSIINTGVITNLGSINNNFFGTIANNAGGSINNLKTILNGGTTNNAGVIRNTTFTTTDQCGVFTNVAFSTFTGSPVLSLCTPVSLEAVATQDTFLREAEANKNFDTNASLEVKEKPGDRKRAVYQFDLSTIPVNAKVTSARLTIRVNNNSDQLVSVYRVTDAWAESTATWTNLGADFAGPAAASFTPLTANQPITVDITALAQSWASGQVANNGIMLIASNDKDSSYGSRERANPTERPSLTVTYAGGIPGATTALKREARGDTFVRDAEANKNFGTNASLDLKEKPGDRKRVVYQFDLSTIPVNAKVASARLTIRVTNNSDQPVNVYRVTDPWAETTATWTNLGLDFAGPAAASFTPLTANQPITVDITTLAQSWANGGANNGIMLIASNDKDSSYGSRERANPTERPALTVTYAG